MWQALLQLQATLRQAELQAVCASLSGQKNSAGQRVSVGKVCV